MWLREAVNPKQGRAFRGWLKHQQNHKARIKRARMQGKTPPGGSRYRLRVPPGYDAGHKRPGVHTAENLRPELASMNRARPGIARRLEKRLGRRIRYR